MASITITIPHNLIERDLIGTSSASLQADPNPYIDMGMTTLIVGATQAYFTRLALAMGAANASRVTIVLANTLTETGSEFGRGPEFTDQFETNGTITITASNGTSLSLSGIIDMTEPYSWTPSVDVRPFSNMVWGLPDRTLIMTFDDGLISNIEQLYQKVNGVWVPVKLHRKTSGSWSEVKLYRKVSGTWVQVSGPTS